MRLDCQILLESPQLYWLDPLVVPANGISHGIGVGAGNVLGVRRNIPRIALNLSEKFLGHFLCIFRWPPKNVLMWFWALFLQIKARWVPIKDAGTAVGQGVQ